MTSACRRRIPSRLRGHGGGEAEALAGNVAGFGEQEPADLCHVGAGGDVDEIVFRFWVEAVAAREITQRRVDPTLEVPGSPSARSECWRTSVPGETCPTSSMMRLARVVEMIVGQQLQPVDEEAGLLAEGASVGRHFLPALVGPAGIEGRARECRSPPACRIAYPRFASISGYINVSLHTAGCNSTLGWFSQSADPAILSRCFR